jgi:hypothetical protein
MPLKSRCVELLEDGTAKPPPAPEAIRSMDDPAARERAETAWYYILRLLGLFDQWDQWLRHAAEVLIPERELALRLAEGVKVCVWELHKLGLIKEPVRETVDYFPDPSQVVHRIPINKKWIRYSQDRLRFLGKLKGNLSQWAETLEENPGSLKLTGGTQPFGPAGSARLPKYISLNEERDQFMYEKFNEGSTYGEIRVAVEKVGSWSRLDTDEAVRRAIIRYAKRHWLEPPPPRKPGRPKPNT